MTDVTVDGAKRVLLTRYDTNESIELHSPRLIVAGYTGRDEASVNAHIAELAAIGIPAPETVPAFYDLDPCLVTTDSIVSITSDGSSGEVEAVLVRHHGQFYLGVGSDHTDRQLERQSIFEAKAACPKPLGSVVVALPSLTEVDWDSMISESVVDGASYQRGDLSSLRTPPDVLDRMTDALGNFDEDLVLFCGTVPLLTGQFVAGAEWHLALHVRDDTVLTLRYTVDRSGHHE
jgi:4-hydroxyphenylacetate 3-monooxygenase